MKKNILTIIIMASCLLNLILTAVIVFAVVPTMNKTSQLVDKVATAIDLETDEEASGDYSIDNLEPYSIAFENKQTINLKPDEGDNTSHFAVLEGVTISFNKEAEDYKEVSESVKAKDVYITETIADQSMKTLNQNAVKEQALAKIQDLYGSKCIVRLALDGFMFQ